MGLNSQRKLRKYQFYNILISYQGVNQGSFIHIN